MCGMGSKATHFSNLLVCSMFAILLLSSVNSGRDVKKESKNYEKLGSKCIQCTVQPNACIVVLLLQICTAAAVEFKGCSLDVIYLFGDSMFDTDTGNLIIVDVHSPFSRPPYDMTSLRKPTGSCSDRLIMIHYFDVLFQCLTLGLPFLNPYLKRGADFTAGANFAVVGISALDTFFLVKEKVPLMVSSPPQIHLFQNQRS
ncbi:hypothetical protein NE237_016894 [Protea cynaroides]|uniref:Uncharacterized protein n=1 Tax=Protea cynaroides TaxID=273540 RepID=A0A9Q0K6Z7_9MAGN|nr:hypothetical protein NE237_016894 [Protea cynaroides]